MHRRRTAEIAAAALLFCFALDAAPRSGIAACPSPTAARQSCRAITSKDLPSEVTALLKSSGCDVAAGSNYDYGVSTALTDDDAPAYQFCCHDAPHGPCAAAIIAKDKGKWRILAKDILGYDADPPCDDLVVLDHQSNGFHDLCIPDMAPSLRVFENGSYRAAGGRGGQ
jgi:hypothetical protein